MTIFQLLRMSLIGEPPFTMTLFLTNIPLYPSNKDCGGTMLHGTMLQDITAIKGLWDITAIAPQAPIAVIFCDLPYTRVK